MIIVLLSGCSYEKSKSKIMQQNSSPLNNNNVNDYINDEPKDNSSESDNSEHSKPTIDSGDKILQENLSNLGDSWVGSYCYYFGGGYKLSELYYWLNIYKENGNLVSDVYVPSVSNGIYAKANILEKDNTIDIVLSDYYFDYVKPNEIGDTLFRLTHMKEQIYTEWIDFIPPTNYKQHDAITNGVCFEIVDFEYQMPNIGKGIEKYKENTKFILKSLHGLEDMSIQQDLQIMILLITNFIYMKKMENF